MKILPVAVFLAVSIAAAQAGPLPIPTSPGVYVVKMGHDQIILGQPVTFKRTGSLLASHLTFGLKAAHGNIQLPGRHAQTVTGPNPEFFFIPSSREAANGITAGDLILARLKMQGNRRQIEVGAEGAMRGSTGISITHQLEVVRTEPKPATYELKPANTLKPGEYAFYLQRGEGLPPMLFDFSVQK
ncbi:MAG TPA: hypothetical protein VNJ52_01220 [Patescibacteria group bacterium]|nr:hypothetical protein [Patescibacteria group bacterium]